MKIVDFESTPGLDQVPSDERYALYWKTHLRLKANEKAYRRRRRLYLPVVVVLAVLVVVISSSSLPSLLALLPLALLVYWGLREKRLMNQAIGEAIQERTAAKTI